MGIKSVISSVNARVKKYQADSEKREEQALRKLKSKAAREKVRADIAKERAKVRLAANAVKTSLYKSEAARKKAKRALGGGIGEGAANFRSFILNITGNAPKKRRRR